MHLTKEDVEAPLSSFDYDRMTLQQDLPALIRLSTWEMEACLSHGDVREHGPDAFFQTIYSAFTIYIERSRMGRTVEIVSLAKCLQEQCEVKEFIARAVDPNKLFYTVVLSGHLCGLYDSQRVVYRGSLVGDPDITRANSFLEIWEEYVHPVLKATENIWWAEKWRGGHITNDCT